MVTKRKPSTADTAASVRRRLKANVERINELVVSPLTPKSDKASKATRGNTKYRPRQRELNEALPPDADLFKRPVYKTGDGDILAIRRPGSDHSRIKSFGTLT